MVLTHFGRSRPEFGSLITLHEANRCLVACKGGGGGLGDVAVFGRFGVKNDRKKKFPNVFGDTLGGIYDVFGWFGRILGHPELNLGLRSSIRCLVVCKRGIWGLSRFRRIRSEKITRKKRCPLRPKRCQLGLPVLY